MFDASIRAGASLIHAFREWRGYSITALALASGVPAATIANHEADRSRLTQEECDAIGAALGVPCDLLHD